MNRIDERFRRLKEAGECALIPYLTAGDPDLATTQALTLEFERRGADLLEIGVPFSDPLADGVTIQRASQRALLGGTTLSR
ncbi:MAG TPA: tryptophan synthase subunit alpha, partial [Candidatus Methylomirabilis sp.]|nr:tryptophan synthase subunit alpha [Candidatus Methylomirabilis sp.]